MTTETAAAPQPTTGADGGSIPAEAVAPSVDSTPAATNVNSVAETLISEAPAPQPHAIEQARAEADAAANAGAEAAKKYPGFDPARHVLNSDGTPGMTPTGRFAKIRTPRKGATPSANTAPANKLNIPAGASAPSAVSTSGATKEQLARKGGAGAAALLVMVGVGLGGDEWVPRKDEKIGLDEKAMLEGAFGDYFVAQGYSDLPPGWALVAAVGMYALPRFGMPKTQTRLQKLKTWIFTKYAAWKSRRNPKKQPAPEQASQEPQS